MGNKIIRSKMSCRLCRSRKLETVLDLGSTALANEYLSSDTHPQEVYPLRLKQCSSCGHVQLAHVVSKEILFDNYSYVSGTSPSFIKHFSSFASETLEVAAQFRRADPTSSVAVLDIGSNDGTLLMEYKKRGCTICGVEPAANLARRCVEIGLRVEQSYFNKALVSQFLANTEQFDIITANNVMAHIDDLHTIFKGVKKLLLKDGFFVFEVSYLPSVIEKLLFDTIYHEHVDYHHINPLLSYLNGFGLRIFDAKEVSTHGGSVRIYVSHIESLHKPTDSLEKLISNEAVECQSFTHMASRLEKAKKIFKDTLSDLKKQESGRLIAYGVPAKFTTFSYHFDLNKDQVSIAVDDSPLKQNRFTPGKLLPIKSFTDARIVNRDIVLISAWNFSKEITEKLKGFYAGRGLRVVIPLPELQVITL
jgi:predicted TPR repeat methyltransferase